MFVKSHTSKEFLIGYLDVNGKNDYHIPGWPLRVYQYPYYRMCVKSIYILSKISLRVKNIIYYWRRNTWRAQLFIIFNIYRSYSFHRTYNNIVCFHSKPFPIFSNSPPFSHRLLSLIMSQNVSLSARDSNNINTTIINFYDQYS